MSRKTFAPIASVLLMSVAAGVAVVAGAPQTPQTIREVDATTFLVAFRTGMASSYGGFRVVGVAADFHGIQTPGGGANMHQPSTLTSLATPQPSVILTVGAIRPNTAPVLLKTWDEWTAADRDATTLDVMLRLPNTPAVAERKLPPSTYEFSGTYLGEQATISRLTSGAKADKSGCDAHGGKHTPTHTEGHGLFPGYPQFYCVPVLASATIK